MASSQSGSESEESLAVNVLTSDDDADDGPSEALESPMSFQSTSDAPTPRTSSRLNAKAKFKKRKATEIESSELLAKVIFNLKMSYFSVGMLITM